jgi:hypothetical protein
MSQIIALGQGIFGHWNTITGSVLISNHSIPNLGVTVGDMVINEYGMMSKYDPVNDSFSAPVQIDALITTNQAYAPTSLIWMPWNSSCGNLIFPYNGFRVARYNPSTDTWSAYNLMSLPGFNIIPSITSITSHAFRAGIDDDKIVTGNGYLSKYDAQNDTWLPPVYVPQLDLPLITTYQYQLEQDWHCSIDNMVISNYGYVSKYDRQNDTWSPAVLIPQLSSMTAWNTEIRFTIDNMCFNEDGMMSSYDSQTDTWSTPVQVFNFDYCYCGMKVKIPVCNKRIKDNKIPIWDPVTNTLTLNYTVFDLGNNTATEVGCNLMVEINALDGSYYTSDTRRVVWSPGSATSDTVEFNFVGALDFHKQYAIIATVSCPYCTPLDSDVTDLSEYVDASSGNVISGYVSETPYNPIWLILFIIFVFYLLKKKKLF